jgi:hypothetical protein
MTPWSQDYDPLHAWPLSTLVAALPVLSLFFVLLALRARVWVAALAGALVAVVLALSVFRMPATMVGGAFALGVQFGLWRIAWIIVASIFLYEVAVETGQFAVMKESIASLSADRSVATDPGRLLLRRLPGGDRRRVICNSVTVQTSHLQALRRQGDCTISHGPNSTCSR